MTDLAAPAGVINLYATPSELKRRLAISDTNHDLELWHLLRVASRVVDGHCGRSFYVSTESKRFDVKDRLRVNVDDLIEVTQVVEDWDGDGVYERVRSRSDLILYPLDTNPQSQNGSPFHTVRLGRRRSRSCFPTGRATLQVTGRWGYRSHIVPLDGYIDNSGSAVTKASRSIPVDDVRQMASGQTILIGSEQMFVRQVGASALSVVRGVNGSPVSEHADGSSIRALQFPAEVVEATLLTAVDRWRRRDGVARSDNVAAGVSRSLYDPSEDVKDLLAPYRRVSI